VKFNIDIKSIIILILILIILFLRNCQGPSVVIEEKVITETVTEYKTVEVEKEVYVPKYYEKIVTDIDTLLINNPIDTLEILREFYAKFYYQDTISLDTLGYIVLNDTITQNKILSREFVSSFQIPEKTITQTVFINPRIFFMGPSVSFTDTGFDRAQWDFHMKDKKNRLYSVGLGVNNNGKPLISTGFKWEID
jgi:hypothetical protein